jgi:hypothetical protein
MNPPKSDATGRPAPADSSDASAAADEATVIANQITVGRSLPGRSVNRNAAGTAPIRHVGRYQILEKLGEGDGRRLQGV